MKSFHELTRRGRLRRLRKLAETALDSYGFREARLTFLRYFANTTYRVDLAQAVSTGNRDCVYIPNRYLLRILTSGDWDKARGEMTWLAALSKEGGLSVPAPIPTLQGDLLLRVATPAIPDGRIVSLMRWIDGRIFTSVKRPAHFQAWGRMVGRLHAFAANWQSPDGFERYIWDWEGLLGGRDFSCSVGELVATMPEYLREPFLSVSHDVRTAMAGLGKSPQAFGMIHGDMFPGNILFKGGDVFPIDFEDCGFGYWLWDIAVALEEQPWTEAGRRQRDAFLEGYLQGHSLPESQLRYLDLFLAANYATVILWGAAFIRDDPARKNEYESWIEENAKKLLGYFLR